MYVRISHSICNFVKLGVYNNWFIIQRIIMKNTIMIIEFNVLNNSSNTHYFKLDSRRFGRHYKLFIYDKYTTIALYK